MVPSWVPLVDMLTARSHANSLFIVYGEKLNIKNYNTFSKAQNVTDMMNQLNIDMFIAPLLCLEIVGLFPSFMYIDLDLNLL